MTSGTVVGGANAIKTCVNDLLKYYFGTIQGWKNEVDSVDPNTSKSPLKNVLQSVIGYNSMIQDSKYEQSYGARWVIAELTAPVSEISINGMLVPEMPIVGKGAPKRKLCYNSGTLVGFFSSIYIIPDAEIIIVVLTNSYALAKESSAKYGEMWAVMPGELAKTKTSKESSRPITDYVGKYYNAIKNFFIQIGVAERNGTDELFLSFQGRSTQTHFLTPMPLMN